MVPNCQPDISTPSLTTPTAPIDRSLPNPVPIAPNYVKKVLPVANVSDQIFPSLGSKPLPADLTAPPLNEITDDLSGTSLSSADYSPFSD